MLGKAEPSRNLSRSAAEQDAEPVLYFDDLTLEICQLCRGSCPFCLEPIEVELRDGALLKAKLGQPDRIPPTT